MVHYCRCKHCPLKSPMRTYSTKLGNLGSCFGKNGEGSAVKERVEQRRERQHRHHLPRPGTLKLAGPLPTHRGYKTPTARQENIFYIEIVFRLMAFPKLLQKLCQLKRGEQMCSVTK